MTDYAPSPEEGSTACLDLQSPPPQLLENASLFLDFDGTLVDLAERPDAVHVSAGLHDLLSLLSRRLDGRLAIVSGRGASDVAEQLGQPSCLIVGSHGAEYRDAQGRIAAPPRSAALEEAVLAVQAFAQGQQGLLVEDKPQGVALHYRMAPQLQEAADSFAVDLARRLGLYLQTGKMMVELRMGGSDKGIALNRLMGQTAMRGTKPVFLGDDDTDETAFRAARALGGAGILVGPMRQTAALWRLPDVAAVHHWLEDAA
ncbi:trehalose-phosphatase [Novosphingobium rosa]|uniref:trehalose-phosphatase n=1 Tax=Novosphingobium rosa TaxID=76978 RepID=UPI00083268A9|nr:trehalose-phosphatase [Novosphingobium rosa]